MFKILSSGKFTMNADLDIRLEINYPYKSMQGINLHSIAVIQLHKNSHSVALL